MSIRVMFGKWSENTSITYNNTAAAMLCQHNEFPELLILFTKHRHSEENIQRDIARAAKFQERKKREMALTTLPVSSSLPASGHLRVPTTSSPSQVEASSTSFYFSKPLPENFRELPSSELMTHTSLYFSRVKEERVQNVMDSSSILDIFPVTIGDNEIAKEVTVEGQSQVSRTTDQTVAGEEEDCLEEEEGEQQSRHQRPRDVEMRGEPNCH